MGLVQKILAVASNLVRMMDSKTPYSEVKDSSEKVGSDGI